MAVSGLVGRQLQDGTLSRGTALGDLFNTYGTGNTPLTTWAASLDTAMAAITTYGTATGTHATAVDTHNTAADTYATALVTAATALNLANNTVCFSTPGLAEGTNANTIQIATAFRYAINGTVYLKAITDNVALTAAAQQATDTDCLYLICIDTAGTVTSVKGTAGAAAAALAIPTPTAGTCAIGLMHISLSTAATFTAATTDLGAANVVDTFVNFVGSNPATAVTATAAIATLSTAAATLATASATLATATTTMATAKTTMNTAIRTTLNAALVAAVPAAL